MSLTNLDSVRTALRIPAGDASQDDVLEQLIGQVDRLIKTWLGRNLEYQTGLVEYLAPDWGPYLRLRNTPVVVGDLAGVDWDPTGCWGQAPGAFAPGTALTAGQDYALVVDQPDGMTSRSGLIRSLWGNWLGGYERAVGCLTVTPGAARGTYRVRYAGGFKSVPADVVLAANLMVARGLTFTELGAPSTSDSYQGRALSVSWGPAQNPLWTPEAVSLLRPYRKTTP